MKGVKNKEKRPAYTRHSTLSVEEVLSRMRSGDEYLQISPEIKVGLVSSRIRTYLKGVKCVECGIEGTVFAVENNGSKWHLNLYHETEKKTVMMTSDHIVSKYLNGGDSADNRQPMCQKCNMRKGIYGSVAEAFEAGKKDLSLLQSRVPTSKEVEVEKLRERIRKDVSTLLFVKEKIESGDLSKNWPHILSRTERFLQSRTRELDKILINIEEPKGNNMNKNSPVVRVANTQYLRSGTSFFPTSDVNNDIHTSLPAGNWLIKVSPMNQLYFDQLEDFSLPGKLYGDVSNRCDRILNTYDDREASTGVLLTGEKGSGKTLLSKLISIRGKEKGYPTILINSPFKGDSFNTLIQGIQQPCIIVFDEFEKIYNKQAQEEILTLLDGVFPTKKLFIFTVNDKYAVNSFMNNRPGRIFYSINYKGISQEFVREYCQDNLGNKGYVDLVCQVTALFNAFNFDMLKALVEDMNRYNETPQEVLAFLNASPENEIQSAEFSVSLTLANGVKVEDDDLYTRKIRVNPMKPSEGEFYIGYLDRTEYTPTENEIETEKLRYNGADCSLEDILDSLTRKHQLDANSSFSPTDLIAIDASVGSYVFKNMEGLVCTLIKIRTPAFSYDRYLPSTF